jgi:hypothetical protein
MDLALPGNIMYALLKKPSAKHKNYIGHEEKHI